MNILFESEKAVELYNNLYHKPSWKNGWRVIVTRRVLEDFDVLPITRFHQNTFKDFDTNSTYFYPFGIAQLVALRRWVWFKSYQWLKDIGAEQRQYERERKRLHSAYVPMDWSKFGKLLYWLFPKTIALIHTQGSDIGYEQGYEKGFQHGFDYGFEHCENDRGLLTNSFEEYLDIIRNDGLDSEPAKV